MRISYWSSYVCSSDLHTDDDAVLGRAVFEQRIFHPVREHAEDDVRVDRNVARRETPCLRRLALRVGGGGCRLRRCFLRIGRGGAGDTEDEGRQRGGGDRKSGVEGKRGSVRVVLGGRR